MEYQFYRCSINNYEYCIFLDNSTLACYLEQLRHMSFEKDKVIVDQLFYSGNKKNRFIVFDIKNGVIDSKTAKNIIITKRMQKKIDSLILKKFSEMCSVCLSTHDYDLLAR